MASYKYTLTSVMANIIQDEPVNGKEIIQHEESVDFVLSFCFHYKAQGRLVYDLVL